MVTVFQKLNLKDQTEIHVLSDVRVVRDTRGTRSIEFLLAIDDDWSALRFRRVEFIKKMTRGPKHTLTKEGRAKARRSRR